MSLEHTISNHDAEVVSLDSSGRAGRHLGHSFEFERKDRTISLRVSHQMLEALKDLADERKMSYQKMIRRAVEAFLLQSKTQGNN